jgi:molecular chaperone GrpE (heat shock protein)
MPDNKDAKQQEIDDFNKELEDLEDAALGALAVPKDVEKRINKQNNDNRNNANQ